MSSGKFLMAGVQMDISLANPNENLEKMELFLRTTTARGAALTVFPECTLTGYCFQSLEESYENSEPADGPSVIRMVNACAELETHCVFGFLERDQQQVFNSLALVGPSGLLGTYRKLHLPFLGVDRFTTPGDRPMQVIETDLCRIGMNICYDSSFPEAARVLSLQGAELIVLPTNWPPTSGLTADFIPNARAIENHVYFAAINRIGQERGFEFIGKSKICDPSGKSLVFANHVHEEILYAEIDPEFARQKHRVNIPGEHEVHRFKDRRPDAYDRISKTS